MSLRNQPYLPLYVQDIMTDEKLNNCSAATHGIYIKGLMCLMHKSENYGKILLNQKFKQNSKQSKNFASMLVKHLPYSADEIENAIDELIAENVCYYDGDFICQKRMIKDNDISIKRSESGKKGGLKTRDFAQAKLQAKHKAKVQANTEYEYENEYEYKSDNNTKNNIPDFETFKSYAIEKLPGVNIPNLKLKYESWVENGWKDGFNKPIKNWKSKILNTLPHIKNETNRTNNRNNGFYTEESQRAIEGAIRDIAGL